MITTDVVLTLFIELLLALVFVRALLTYLRRRDPLSRDVMLLFSSLAVLFVVEVVRRTVGPPPALVSNLAAVFVLAQPYLALRVVSRIRAIPRWVLPASLVAYAVTALPVLVLPRPLPVALTLAVLAVFVVEGSLAAAYFFVQARRRTGAARVRLVLASIGTASLAVAILIVGTGSANSQLAATTGALARFVALAAALAYFAAFIPPSALTRFWRAAAAYDYTEALLGTPATEDVGALWRRLSEVAVAITGSRAAVVLGPGTEVPVRVLGVCASEPVEPGAPYPEEELRALLQQPAFQRPLEEAPRAVAELARRVGARYYTVVRISPPVQAGRAPRDEALVLLADNPSLFGTDDEELLAGLGARTALLAERRMLLAEQEHLAHQLASTVEALRTASQAKSDFLASMSHELRTPLSAIIGFSELMLAEERRDDALVVPVEWVEHIHRSGDHLLGLINDVLDLAKIEAGRLELHPEPFDLPGAVGESIAGLKPLAERKRLRLESEVDSLRLVADRGRFRQVLYNLLSNAIKFTPEGGRVRVEAARSDGHVAVSVVDTGIGIAEEDQPHVFEEFRQVGDPASKEAGTGLGLALTRRLVEAHDGRIELESAPGVGSRFTLFFPDRAPSAAAAGSSPSRRLGGSGLGQDGPEVLVVEDDASAAELIRTYLEGDGYRVRVAGDGEEALAEAASRVPAAIVLDVLLPDLDGWEVLRRLKSDDRLRDVPVIIVSVVDEREVGLALGAVDYFLKPVDRVALLSRLARYTFTTKVKERPVRVLAVDDDPATLELVGATLRGEGFDVLTAHGGRQGLDLALTEQVDLVICDLLMPDLDGFAVVAAIKADRKTRDIPILILTGYELTAAEEAGLNGKVLDVLKKGEPGLDGLGTWLRSVTRNERVPAAAGAGR